VEIERDIDETRREMDSTMDAIGGKFHPKRLIDYFFEMMQNPSNRDRTRDAVQDFGGRVSASIRENPIPAMLVGAGMGWIVWNMQHSGDHGSGPSMQEKVRQRSSHFMDKVKTAAGSARETVGAAVGSAKEHMHSAAGSAHTAAQGAIGSVKGHAESAAGSVSGQSGRLREGYERSRAASGNLVHEHPLALGIFAMTAGILSGLAFPSTRTESRVAGEKSEEVWEKAETRVRETAEAAKPGMEEAFEKAKSGLQNAAESAKSGVKNAAESAQSGPKGTSEGLRGGPRNKGDDSRPTSGDDVV
jgi:uncharacterized protein YjbJ (UPF0337 family)